MGEKLFVTLKFNKQIENKLIDLFARLVELKVQIYLPSYPYRSGGIDREGEQPPQVLVHVARTLYSPKQNLGPSSPKVGPIMLR